MIKVFNTTFENSLRMLLLLSGFQKPELLDRLYITDFLAVYGKDFNITQENLNGDNDFKYSEFQSRKELCRKALKDLVVNGMVTPHKDGSGILYELTDAGNQFAESLQSEYATEYRQCAKAARAYISNYSNRQAIAMINQLSTDSVRSDSHE